MDKIIEELDKTVEAKCFLAAMTLALTVPSVCSKVEFQNIKNETERYPKWCEKYITNKMLTPKEYYALRCAVLHNGNDELENQKILQKVGQLKKFSLNIPYMRYGGYPDTENTTPICAAAVISSIKEAYNRFKEENPNFIYSLSIDKE